MHVRFSTIKGMPVTDDQMEQDVGILSGIVLQPDSAKVEGFYVSSASLFASAPLYLSASDVLHIGSRIRIRHADVLAPVEEIIRLQSLLEDGRTIIDQPIHTEQEQRLGICRDIQFDTHTFASEWLFPKKWLRWQRPVPVSAIVEVREDAVLVRTLSPVPAEETVIPSLDLNAA